MRGVGHKIGGLMGAVALLALAGGCTSIRDHRGYVVDKTLIDAVQPGVDNKSSVERTLGRPSFISQFGEPSWYYVSSETKRPPLSGAKISDETVLRIRFDASGNVVAVDKSGMEKVAKIDPDGNKTPTLGRDRGLMEDLFGNIGAVGMPGGGGGAGGGSGGGM